MRNANDWSGGRVTTALVIREGVSGVYFYHLARGDQPLCGATRAGPTMATSLPLNSWGQRTHLGEKYCRECDRARSAPTPFTMPILGSAPRGGQPIRITWIPVAADHGQAGRNHGQSLETLASRGGLGWAELLAVLEHRRWTRVPDAEAERRVRALLAPPETKAPHISISVSPGDPAPQVAEDGEP